MDGGSANAFAEIFTGASNRPRQYRLRDLVAALNSAKDDDRVKAVALDLDGFAGGGQVAMADLADALARVRASGKPVIAYATGYTDDSYQLASAASEVWLNPLGAVPGLAVEIFVGDPLVVQPPAQQSE